MEAIVSVKKMNLVCIIGTEPHERVTEQVVEVDVDIALSEMKACFTDELSDAVNYISVADICLEVASKGEFKLIEALAHAIAKKVKDSFQALWVKVKVFKPRPLPHVEGCSVEITLKK